MMLRVFLLSLLSFAYLDAIEVQIEQGILSGSVLKSRNGYNFHAFYGIPYAQPPVGELRWQPPHGPAPSWLGVRRATQEGEVCPQFDVFRRAYRGSEDCLFLNIYTRDINPAVPAPVLVFIHGGGFTTGSGALTGPEYFMDRPIIMVTINYRLGVLGYLSTGDPYMSGNYGLKDQTEALRWIQKNIHAFGGDPRAVTIMGQSSGGASIHFHTLSPLSKGLFHRAIVHSGCATHPQSLNPPASAQRSFYDFYQQVYCTGANQAEIVNCLKSIPPEQLIEAAGQFMMKDHRRGFRPVIESANIPGAFLTNDPRSHIYYDTRVPMIFGFTSNEAGVHSPEVGMLENLKDEYSFYSALPQVLRYQTPDDPHLEYNITTLIKNLYFGGNLAYLSANTASRLLSDVRFKIGIADGIKNYPGIKYAFEYDYTDPQAREAGAFHTEDLKSLFPFQLDPHAVLSDDQRRLSEIMITYWSNFVMTGDPNSPDGTVPIRWQPVRTPNVEFLHIANEGLNMLSDVSRGKSEFWYYFEKSQKPQPPKQIFSNPFLTSNSLSPSSSLVTSNSLIPLLSSDPGYSSNPGFFSDPGLSSNPEFSQDPGLSSSPVLSSNPFLSPSPFLPYGNFINY